VKSNAHLFSTCPILEIAPKEGPPLAVKAN
jgi:hypothetical protein